MTDDEIADFVLSHSRIPDRYRDRTLDDLSATDPRFGTWTKKANDYVRDFLTVRTSQMPGLFICSPTDVGIGKSHLACCILRGLIVNGRIQRQATFFAFADLMRSLVAEARAEMSEEDAENIHRLRTSEVIVFDDLDKFMASEAAVFRLHRIISDLWDRNVPLIVTCGSALNTMIDRFAKYGVEEQVAQSIVSRLQGMCDTWTIDFGGRVDYRKDKNRRATTAH